MKKFLGLGLIAALAVAGLIGFVLPADAVVDTATIVTSPNVASSQNNSLASVSCVSTTSCVAVGNYDDGAVQHTLVESFDGTAWTVVASPNSSPTEDNYLSSVSCVSVTFCVAVGSSYDGNYNHTLVLAFDGTSWTKATSPDSSPTEDNFLSSVSCTSGTSCVAVGTVDNGSKMTLVQSFDGTAWTVVASPSTDPNQPNFMMSVSCTSATSCVAVGYFDDLKYQTLALSFDGTNWTIVASPSSDPNQNNFLESVSCTSATSCVAVGYYRPGNRNQTLVLSFDGTTWTQTTSPNTNVADHNYLYSVSCISATSCIAVGAYNEGADDHTLVLSFDGTAWTQITSPNSDPLLDNELDSVFCVASSSCTAVGARYDGALNQTLVMSLTGPQPPDPSTTTTSTTSTTSTTTTPTSTSSTVVPSSTTSSTSSAEPVIPAFAG